ncbi:unnamed protein product [Owenia fusiformis]|uniref:Uncharacterized protein n=1 Tax=Owenia fusiformis TaxID=6347 RepID=A0A8J1YBP6_OWEFU|nr:unnamed protein product [Owenia fusiformis]
MDRKKGHLTKNVKDVTKSLMWIKMIGVGNISVGKTCLIKHFCESKFSSVYQPTVGVDYGFKIAHIVDLDLRVHLWDLSGNAEYIDVRNELYTNTDAIFLVFDITNPGSFECLENWLKEIHKYSQGHQPEIVVVGNKHDLKAKRNVKEESARRWATQHKFSYFETSTATGYGVETMFKELLTNVAAKKNLLQK